MMDGMLKALKMTCKDVYPLISESQDHPLTFLSRIRLKMHLAICELCEIYRKQLEIICRITRSMGKDDSKVLEDTNMNPEVKEKINQNFLGRQQDLSEKITKTESEWQKILTEEQFKICRKKGTEPAFSGKHWDCHDRGNYHCVCCDTPLFSSIAKFDSGTGWPSYYEPLRPESITTEQDTLFFMRRTEVLCSKCDCHLGHVFEDGPDPTGLRYCINSTSLVLHKAESS